MLKELMTVRSYDMMSSPMPASKTNENLDGSFECSRCHRRFQSQSELSSHINLEHEKRLPLAGVS
jgi:hypothetical protein